LSARVGGIDTQVLHFCYPSLRERDTASTRRGSRVHARLLRTKNLEEGTGDLKEIWENDGINSIL